MPMLRSVQSVQIEKSAKDQVQHRVQWLIVRLICIAIRHLMEHFLNIDYVQLELKVTLELQPLQVIVHNVKLESIANLH